MQKCNLDIANLLVKVLRLYVFYINLRLLLNLITLINRFINGQETSLHLRERKS